VDYHYQETLLLHLWARRNPIFTAEEQAALQKHWEESRDFALNERRKLEAKSENVLDAVLEIGPSMKAIRPRNVNVFLPQMEIEIRSPEWDLRGETRISTIDVLGGILFLDTIPEGAKPHDL